MAKITRLDTDKPRRLRETVFTGDGLRLAARDESSKRGWFKFAIIILPIGAFCLVYFW